MKSLPHPAHCAKGVHGICASYTTQSPVQGKKKLFIFTTTTCASRARSAAKCLLAVWSQPCKLGSSLFIRQSTKQLHTYKAILSPHEDYSAQRKLYKTIVVNLYIPRDTGSCPSARARKNDRTRSFEWEDAIQVCREFQKSSSTAYTENNTHCCSMNHAHVIVILFISSINCSKYWHLCDCLGPR